MTQGRNDPGPKWLTYLGRNDPPQKLAEKTQGWNDLDSYDEPVIQTSAIRFFIHTAKKQKESDIQFL